MNESTASYLIALIRHFCERNDLSGYDPYDVWKTRLGVSVKELYYRRRSLGAFPAGLLVLFDLAINNSLRIGYRKAEYPIVRSIAAQCLLNLYRHDRDPRLLAAAAEHLEWLLTNSSPGYSGHCWGLGFPHVVGRSLTYDSRTPFSTITAYALEAFVQANELCPRPHYGPAIQSVFSFFDRDIRVMEEDDHSMATSYGPFRDRTVTNAVSYTMFAFCLYLPYAPAARRPQLVTAVRKMYSYIRRSQRSDGAWLYSQEGRSFIDCFHSCIVLKNLIKSSRVVELKGVEHVVSAGYEYLLKEFLDSNRFLFRRFSVQNKPSLVRFDLYDNAEAMNLALLMGDVVRAHQLLESILHHFTSGADIYSQLDLLGFRRNKNTLRWAVMPFLLAASRWIGVQD